MQHSSLVLDVSFLVNGEIDSKQGTGNVLKCMCREMETNLLIIAFPENPLSTIVSKKRIVLLSTRLTDA